MSTDNELLQKQIELKQTINTGMKKKQSLLLFMT